MIAKYIVLFTFISFDPFRFDCAMVNIEKVPHYNSVHQHFSNNTACSIFFKGVCCIKLSKLAVYDITKGQQQIVKEPNSDQVK